jgi:hypothetical protein
MALTKEQAKSLFKKANDNVQDDSEKLPPGKYYVKLTECKKITTQDDKEMIIHEFEVLEGDYTGKKHALFTNIEHEVSLSIMFGYWRKFGYDTTAIDTLEDLLEHVDDINSNGYLLNITVAVNKKDTRYSNTYIDSLVEEETGSDEAEEPTQEQAQSPEDSIPEDPEIEEDEPQDLSPGDEVFYMLKGEKLKGKIVKIDYDNEILTVKDSEGKDKPIPLANVSELA